jgi:hypothetical protein
MSILSSTPSRSSGRARAAESTSPPTPPTTPSRTRSGAAPAAIGLLAAGIYGLILTAYLSYLPSSNGTGSSRWNRPMAMRPSELGCSPSEPGSSGARCSSLAMRAWV